MDPKKQNSTGLIREGHFLHGKSDQERKAAEVDLEEMIERSKCARIYHQLEECLGEHDRDWRKCQKEVKLLKQCSLEGRKEDS